MRRKAWTPLHIEGQNEWSTPTKVMHAKYADGQGLSIDLASGWEGGCIAENDTKHLNSRKLI